MQKRKKKRIELKPKKHLIDLIPIKMGFWIFQNCNLEKDLIKMVMDRVSTFFSENPNIY